MLGIPYLFLALVASAGSAPFSAHQPPDNADDTAAWSAWCSQYRDGVELASDAQRYGPLDARLVRACATRAAVTSRRWSDARTNSGPSPADVARSRM